MSQSPLNILVVEDNQNVRTLTSLVITQLGHVAHAVVSAEEALKTLNGQAIDILLADINLAGMSGVALPKQAVLQWPHLKIIFASGFGYLLADKDQTNFEFILLPKPYGLEELKGAIERLSRMPASKPTASA